MSEQIKVNTIPSLTWNWMKINNDNVNFEVPFKEAAGNISGVSTGVTVSSDAVLTNVDSFGSGIFNFANPKLDAERYAPGRKDNEESGIQNAELKAEPATNHELYKLVDNTVKCPQNIVLEGKISEPVVINFATSENTASVQNIVAKPDSDATVILVYEGETAANQIVLSRVYAQENSKIHIVKVQLLGNSALQLDDTAVVCDENAEVHFTQIELGGSHVDSGLHVNLNGYKSRFISNVAYLCKDNQFLDMNHIVYHYGQKTECNMKVNGSLKDNAVKTYRGTIDFKNGCAGSKGNEMEETLLLNPKVVNKSLPVILCDEEDVEGEHGATIGRLSNDVLFYMQTRGISQAEAERLMSLAKVQAVAELIPSEDVKEKINKFLGE